MPTELQDVHSVEEFQRLYYPEPDPELEYFDATEPDLNGEHEPSVEPGSTDALDRFSRVLSSSDLLRSPRTGQ
jgi:hypothetical protein